MRSDDGVVMVGSRSKSLKTKLPGVSVIIPSYNCKAHVLRSVKSLESVKYPDLEILVIDNGSKDGTISAVEKQFPKVRCIDAGVKNIGLTGCRNLGMLKARRKSKYFLLIDSDVTTEKGMIRELVALPEDDPKIGIVTPMVLYLSDNDWVNQAGSFVNLTTGKVSIGWGPKKEFKKSREIQNSGTVLLVKRDVIEKSGGFDNDLFMCYEDVDFCLRAKEVGFTVWYAAKAQCYHDQSKDPDVWRPRVLGRAYMLGRNRTLCLKRHSPHFWIYLLLTPFYVAYYAREAIVFRQPKQIGRFIKGILDGARTPLRPGPFVPLTSD